MAYNRMNLLVAIVSLVGVLYLFNNDLALGVSRPCEHNQRFYPSCVDDYNYEISSCSEFGYPEKSVHGCESGTSCKYGQCMPTTCLESASVCATDFSSLYRECKNGRYIDTLQICSRGTRCENGSCIAGGEMCGDGVCDVNETIGNCYQDCWSLSSWDSLAKQVSADPNLAEYTKCVNAFDCNTREVSDMADFIYRNIQDKTPKGYIDAVAGFSNNYIKYVRGGGEKICGESASSLIIKKEQSGVVEGNCIDKSTLMVALLRAKGIPARHVGGCLSNINFECQAYSIAGVPLEYGNMNEAQPLAHAYLEVWADPTIGWAIADPTMGATMSKCVGYYTLNIEGRDHQQLCYLDSAYNEYCKQV